MKFNRRAKKMDHALMKKLITIIDRQHVVAEQFRTLRATISFMLPNTAPQAIVMTSSIPAEGKSTSVANLAVVFAQEGKRVLLIDGDLRRPSLHKMFRTANYVGLSNLLTNQQSFNEVLHTLPIVDLYLLASGPPPPNPSELLSSRQMKELLEEAKQQFDIILIDAPPILSVADAQLMAHQCDGTILVVNTEKVKKHELIRAKANLIAAQPNILGIIMNEYQLSKKQDAYQYYGSLHG